MKASVCALAALLLSPNVGADGFAAPSAFVTRGRRQQRQRQRGNAAPPPRMAAAPGGGELDHVLGEGWEEGSSGGAVPRGGAVLCVPDGSPAVTLASSLTSPRMTEDDVFAEDDVGFDADVEGSEDAALGEGVESFAPSTGDAASDDPYVREILRKKQLREVRQSPFNPRSLLEGKDFTDIFFTVIVPIGAAAYGARWLYGKSSEKLGESADEMLEGYAREMCYHDGDLEEMRMCHDDYKKRLAWIGPNKKDRMIKAYLETFAKKVLVSPQSISSLSYVFSLYKLSEDKAAQILSDLCLSIPDKTASTGKLLFFGTRILKSPEALSKLDPIRDMLASSYREDAGISGEEIVSKSQGAMGEAAYREAVNAAGKSQTELTVGWEVLGLSRETAERIWEEEREAGFVSSKEAKYSRGKLRYDDKGRRVDESGKVVYEKGEKPPAEEGAEDGGKDEEEEDEGPTSNVYECGECGYTLFVAEGRDAKFFGSGFTCPECGAAKDKFVGRTAGED